MAMGMGMMMMTRAFLLWIFITTGLKVAVVVQAHQTLCVQFGLYVNFYDWDYGNNEMMNWKPGVWSIGTKRMDALWLGSLSSSYSNHRDRSVTYADFLVQSIPSPQNAKCPWQWATECPGVGYLPPGELLCVAAVKIELCVDNSIIRMDTYLVKQGGRILQGWLHVQIELVDQSQGEIELVYIEMRDEKFEAVGEFVNADVVPGAVCERPQPDQWSTPTKHQAYPCQNTFPRDAKASQGVMMAKTYFPQVDRSYLHTQPMTKGIHFLWRTGEYWCNRHQKIQPFAMVLTTKNRLKYRQGEYYQKEKMYRKVPDYWIHPKWFGAADVIFKRGEDGKLDCSEKVFDDNTGILTPAAASSWIQSSSSHVLKTDNWNPYYRIDKRICLVNQDTRAIQDSNYPTFAGRCSEANQKDSDRKYFQECNTNASAPEFEGLNATNFKGYEEFIQEKKVNRSEFCEFVSCRVPSTQEDYDGIMSYTPLNDTEDDVKPDIIVGKNDPRTRSKHFKLRVARKYHGIMFSFLAFLITPASIFVSRNYKETYMRKRCYGVHLWYWTHIGGIVATLCLGSSGHSALTQFFRVWGRATEESADLHRTFGYASYGSYFFLLVFGGLRIRAPGVGRLVTITLHALAGFAHHWLNLVAVMYSTWIPMSPSLKDCDQKGMPEGISPIFWLAVGWTVIDFIFHLILTILHIHRDRVIGIRRTWYFPIIPLADNDQMVDMAGSGLRKILLYIYLTISISIATLSSALIMYHKLPKHCQFGNSTCQSWAGCTQIALKYAEWVKHQGGT